MSSPTPPWRHIRTDVELHFFRRCVAEMSAVATIFFTLPASLGTMNTQWYLYMDETESGPYSLEGIGAVLRGRVAREEVLARREAMEYWLPAPQFPELAGLMLPVQPATPLSAAAKSWIRTEVTSAAIARLVASLVGLPVASFLGIMVLTSAQGWWQVLRGLLMLVAAGWAAYCLVQSIRELGDHTKHPALVDLSKDGALAATLWRIDGEVEAPAARVGKARLLSEWLVYKSLFKFEVVSYRDVMAVKVRSRFSFATGFNHQVAELTMRSGRGVELHLARREVDRFVEELSPRIA